MCGGVGVYMHTCVCMCSENSSSFYALSFLLVDSVTALQLIGYKPIMYLSHLYVLHSTYSLYSNAYIYL